MFNSFKDCVITNLAACSIEIKGGVYFTIEHLLKKTIDSCVDEVPLDIPTVL